MKDMIKGKVGTIIILLFTLVLAGVAIFTAVRLYQLRSQPVAPNVPSSIPRAASVCGGIAGTSCGTGEVCIYSNGTTRPPFADASGTCQTEQAGAAGAGSCSLSFALTANTPTPTPTATPGGVNISAQCSSTGDSATLTWNLVTGATKYNVRLDQLDNNISACTDGWYCSDPPDKMLDNLTGSTTTVSVASGKNYEVWVHYVKADGTISSPSTHTKFVCNVNNTPTPTPTTSGSPTPTPTGTPNSCNGTCGSNFNCQNGLMCYQGFCRNPSCASSSSCSCGGSTPTPTPTSTTPTLPQSGTDWPTVAGFGLGIFVIIGSLLLAL